MPTFIILLLVFVAIATASSKPPLYPSTLSSSGGHQETELEYIESICMPPKSNSTEDDPEYPCNAFNIIMAECLASASGNINEAERLCACQSQLWNQLRGCSACYKAHGAPVGLSGYLADDQIGSMSSAYCAVTATPTAGLFDYLMKGNAHMVGMYSTVAESKFSDPLSSSTAVSLYLTPSITGSAVTEAASTGNATTSTHTSNGQIVATATSGGTSNKGSTSGGLGAGWREGMAVAGMVGLAGLLVML